jgi:hypothetical protein
MSSMRSSTLALLVLLPILPVLQGAGCRAHYSAHIHGNVALDGGGAAERLQVIYRTRSPGTIACTEDWAPCLRDGSWRPLGSCEQASEASAAPAARVGAFDGCTAMVGVDYQADFAAFVDANGDGKLGAGERYGVYPQNPVSRDREAQLLPLEIGIDRTMPGPADAEPEPGNPPPPPVPAPPRPAPSSDVARGGEVCRSGARSGGGIDRPCAPGLQCCYPCGVEGCDSVCMADCGPPRP